MRNTKMRSLKARAIYLLIICSLFSFRQAKAQDIEATYNFAQQCYERGDYESALKYYERVMFFSQDYKRVECYVNLGNCFNALNETDDANGYYQLAYFATDNDSLKNEMIFLRAENMLLQRQYLFALQELFTINVANDQEEKRQDFYLAVTYFGMKKFDLSKDYFLKTVPSNDSVTIWKLDALFEKNDKLKRIHPKTARILSMIIPGLGQFYAGDIRNGVNSLLLTTAFLALAVDVGITYSILDATGSIFPWYFRYYMGGFKRAETLAISRVDMKRARIYRQILAVLEAASQKP